MKVLVITTCTADQLHEPSNPLQQTDFATPGLLRLRSQRLQHLETPAAQMYTGSGHLHLMNGVNNLRRTFKQRIIVDLRIISPGYGLLNECDPIVPYNYTFEGQGPVAIRQRSHRLRIHEKIMCLLSNYAMVFFLLSENYVTACELPCRVRESTQIFLVPPGLMGKIFANGLYIHAVCLEPELVDRFPSANPRNLKGVVFERLCTVACDRGIQVLYDVKQDPQRIREFIL